MGSQKAVSKKHLQSLLCSLLHITKCVKNSRVFLNRMLQTFHSAHGSSQVLLGEEFYKDLNWFRQFLLHFNGVCLYDHKPQKGVVQIDTSLTAMGSHWGNCVYKLDFPLGFEQLGIVQLEMLNVFLALGFGLRNGEAILLFLNVTTKL